MSYAITHFYRFAEFAVDVDERLLMRGNARIPLTPKVFETLLILLERSGRLVTKSELMDRLWPDSFVEDDNLTFNIQQVRRALGDNARNPIFIETVARRGYRFIAEVEEVLAEGEAIPGRISARANSDMLRTQNVARHVGHSAEGVEGSLSIAALLDKTVLANKSGLRAFLIALVVVLALFIAGVLTWKYRHGLAPQQQSVTNTSAGFLPPLKIEKLTSTSRSRQAVISPDGKYVAYSNEVKGRDSIWVRQLETGVVKEIVSFGEGYVLGMAFSHDGSNLYFVKASPEPSALYRVPMPLGGVPKKLIDRLEGAFSLSPDDSQVVFIRYSADDKECALMISKTDGTGERALSVHPQPDRFNAPVWSPDGQTIVVAAGPSDRASEDVRILELSVADGSERELSAGRWSHISRLVWLPDKSGLIVVAARVTGDTKQLWRISNREGEVRQLTDGPLWYADLSMTAHGDRAVGTNMALTSAMWIGPADETQNLKRVEHAAGGLSWLPDGRIIYSSNTNVDRNRMIRTLWVMKTDGTEQKQLTDAAISSHPTATPDGRYIVFVSNLGGTYQLWRMNSDGNNKVQLTSGEGVMSPAISHDGKWVIYYTVASQYLWKVPVDGGQSVQLSKRAALFPSVSPDGKLIACIGKDHNKQRRLLIFPVGGGAPMYDFPITPLRLSCLRLWWESDGSGLIYAASQDGVTSFYKQSLSGGLPKKLSDLGEEEIFDFAYSPDGQQLATIRGGWHHDVVLINSSLAQR
ncbi:MAG TPA: winged helix-turn-helix domain-containing protein [Pyrinomonadaceae bacterium]